MILLRMFFVFEGLWRKFFGALEAWIRRASPICGLLMFLEAFKLDSSDLWDLGRWFGWFLFECSLYSKLKFLKFLEASKLGSNRASGLLNLDLLWNALGRLLFIGVWGWVSNTWWSLIGDTCHSLIGLLMSLLTHAGLLVSSLTCARLLVSSPTRVRLLVSSLTRALIRDWLFAWHLANFRWLLSSDSKI